MNLSSVVRWLEGIQGPLPYAAVLAVAFAEHALLIGSLVPGEVILPLVGVVAATTGAVAWLPAALCATGARLILVDSCASRSPPAVGRSAPVMGDLGRFHGPRHRCIIRQKAVRPMPVIQRAPPGGMGSGGIPASPWTPLGPRSQALGAAGEPAAAVGLRDGVTVYLRPVRAEDAAAIRRLFQGLSETSTWLRFFTVCPSLDRVVGWATKVDNDRRLGVVAIAADSGQLVAHAGLERDHRQPDRAEFAVAIADCYQGCGLGRVLLGRLVEAARQAGIRSLIGEVLANNHRCCTCFATRAGP